MKRLTPLIGAALFALTSTSTLSAAAILMVDFDSENNDVTSLTETGFQSYVLDRNESPSTPTSQGFSTSIGTVTVDLSANFSLTSRDRGAIADSGDFTYGDMLRDFAGQFNYRNTVSPETDAPTESSLTLSGLQPSTSYRIQLYSVNKGYDNGATYSWWDMTGDNETLIGSVINSSSPSPSDNDAYSIVGTVMSDASGVLDFGLSLTAGTGTLNGIILSEVPEPSTYALLAGVGALGLALWRRKRS